MSVVSVFLLWFFLLLLASANKRTPEELQAFRDKITKERKESQRLLKAHKALKEAGRLDEAAQVMNEIYARKERLNIKVAEEAGLGETYLKYRKASGQVKKHPFASSATGEKSRLDWEKERNQEMKNGIDAKCQSMRQQAAGLTDAEVWSDKIGEYQQLQNELLDQQFEVSKSLEEVRFIKDAAEKKAFLAQAKQRRLERRPQETATYARIDSLHKELGVKFGTLEGDKAERVMPDL